MKHPTHKKIKGSESRLFHKLKKKMSELDNSTHDKPEGDLKVRLIMEKNVSQDILHDAWQYLRAWQPELKRAPNDFELAKDIVEHFCNKYNIELLSARERSGIITLKAPVETFENFFKVDLAYHEYEVNIKNSVHSKVVMGHTDHVHVPHELHGLIHSVVGLRHTPMDPQAITLKQMEDHEAISAAFGKTSAWMAKYYDFPTEATGKGQHIGIIACGGGFVGDEFTKFFKRVGLDPAPKINTVDIDGVGNAPGQNWLYDYELATDTLVAGCAAPGIEITIYFCDGKLDSFMDTIEHIIDQENGPNIISYSWGGDEVHCADQIEGVNRILEEATLDFNKTIFCSSGDFGSTNNSSYPKERDELAVQYPSSSPWVTSCGGTMFKADNEHTAIEEVAWNSVFLYGVLIKNATGGGFSEYISRPDFQLKTVPDLAPEGYINPDWFPQGTKEKDKEKLLIEKFKTQRAVPDVAGHASLAPNGFGYWVNFQNEDWLTGGTSAVAPLWAALTARLNEALGEDIGYFNPKLYAMADSDAFKPIENGHNGLLETNTHWVAGTPWNPCTGLGVPNGENMLKKLRAMQKKAKKV